MRRSVLLGAATVLFLIAGVVPADAGGWTQYGGDAGHTFRAAGETAISVGSVSSLAPAWRTTVSPRLGEITGIAAADGTVYVVPIGRALPDDRALTRLYAFDLTTGGLRWSTRLPGWSRWAPTIDGGTVLVTLDGPDLVLGVAAVDAATGARRWIRRLDCTYCSPAHGEMWPVVADDGVAIAAAGGSFVGGHYQAYGQLWAFDVDDGTELWTRETRLPGLAVILDGAAIVNEESVKMNADESILALDLRTGEQRWRRTRRIRWVVFLSGAGTEVFVATGARLMSLSTADGALIWRRQMGTVVGAPTVGGRRLYVTGYRGSEVAAFDRATGELRWSRPAERFGYNYLSRTFLVNDVLFLAGRHEYGDRPARPIPYDRSWAIRASSGRIVCALPRHLWGMEFYNTAVADGFVLKGSGTRLEAFTVPAPVP
ncbi:MAG TPA: PQQ-binding-like beta-propeller repeat protein [Actinomycetota bacterium]